ncbi:hypothetical protein HDV04_005815 [Boothiomyces sp. JEL0838]|nr:hypothetical protein HDV04_005815 [Boothiomyces sp. JEL0838]
MAVFAQAIFKEKVTVSSVVGEWYFDRFDDATPVDNTWWHFEYVFCRSLGTISFASLILGIIKSIQYMVRQIERFSSKKFLSRRFVLAVLGFLERTISNFNSYVLVYVGLAGESLYASAYQCTKLFRRNLVLGLVTANISRLFSLVGKLLVSSFIGLVCFWNSFSIIDANGGEWITAAISSIIPFYVMGILTHVLETTIDSTFVCYLIDLDQNSCHNENAHRIFSRSLK